MGNDSESHYTPLLDDEPGMEAERPGMSVANATLIPSKVERTILLYRGLLASQSFIILVFIVFNWSKYSKDHRATCSQVIYSPAQHLLEYHPVTFSQGFDNLTTVFQGPPSDTVDKAWSDLYNDFGISEVSEEEAKPLFNQTVSRPNGKYLVGLAVFHELHCLNMIRKALRPDYYKDPTSGAIGGIEPKKLEEHVSHCIDDLRQSAMCASDISPIVWHRKTPDSIPTPRMDVVHSCRRFDKVVEWAKAHRAGSTETSI